MAQFPFVLLHFALKYPCFATKRHGRYTCVRTHTYYYIKGMAIVRFGVHRMKQTAPET